MFGKNSLVCILLFTAFMVTTGAYSQTNNSPEIYDNDFCRKIIYTWTTLEQISLLRVNKILLTKNKSETKGFAVFDISLRDSALKNNPFAKLLQEEQFAKKRFAWTHAWATLMGWEGETYGNQLIKLVLNDSAIVGKFDPYNRAEPFRFYDLKGNVLDTNYVLKNKNRIAAMYHINQQKGMRIEYDYKTKGTYSYIDKKIKKYKKVDIPFREFVLVNEKMIETWSYGTTDVKNELTDEIKLLNEFAKSKEAEQTAFTPDMPIWGNRPETSAATNSFAQYLALICFQNDHYLFNTKSIQHIITALELALKQQSAEITK